MASTQRYVEGGQAFFLLLFVLLVLGGLRPSEALLAFIIGFLPVVMGGFHHNATNDADT